METSDKDDSLTENKEVSNIEKKNPDDNDTKPKDENDDIEINGQENVCLNYSTDTIESGEENIESIKRFIEEQSNPTDILLPDINKMESNSNKDVTTTGTNILEDENKLNHKNIDVSVMHMILSDPESQGEGSSDKSNTKQNLSNQNEKGNSMSLTVGSKVEAKDFTGQWHPAEIIEVDYDEMEVLVHYEEKYKRLDEWINVNSPRLRPFTGEKVSAPPIPECTEPLDDSRMDKLEDKVKAVFAVGERCLAKWRDNRRFMATVKKDMGDGSYEIVFDDGFTWKCKVSRINKLKNEDLSSTSQQALGPSNSPGKQSTLPSPFHTHLFDPTRDYLGSKSERRALKRKLNIKEIFNIGQKKFKKKSPKTSLDVERKQPKIRKVKKEKVNIKKEIPDAVASIIGTVTKEENVTKDITDKEIKQEKSELLTKVKIEEIDEDEENITDEMNEDFQSTETVELSSDKSDMDPVQEEDKLENFEKLDDSKHEEVIDKIKEAINKLEGGLNQLAKEEAPQVLDPPVDEPKIQPNIETKIEPEIETEKIQNDIQIIVKPIETAVKKEKDEKVKAKLSKIKKCKKLRLLQEKKVKKQVEKVKSELEEMKKQVEEMRKQMLEKPLNVMPESFLLPGEWCCKWVNGQPVGKVSEIESDIKYDANNKPVLPRRSVQVEDKRLPPGWTKHMVRRSLGNSAGKWDVVLISPENRRFHTKGEMRVFLENNVCPELKPYEHALLDFGIHLKLSRRMGWVTETPDADIDNVVPLPAGTLSSTSPLVKRKKLSLIKKENIKKKKKKIRREQYITSEEKGVFSTFSSERAASLEELELPPSTLEDGYVYVGSLKVQIIENLLRCPAEGCFKNFRNKTLLKMHIKHYHRDLKQQLGATPQVLDLAYERTRPHITDIAKIKKECPKQLKVKLPRLKRFDVIKTEEVKQEQPDIPIPSDDAPRQQDPNMTPQNVNRPVKRPKVLLPVRRTVKEESENELDLEGSQNSNSFLDYSEQVDYEAAISTHTVTKPLSEKKKKVERKKFSEDEDWYTDVETRSSFAGSGTPDSKTMDSKMANVMMECLQDRKRSEFMYTESGERIKIVHMKREEIINCHCGFREEDGLMVQCELCLCWQHALCHNIQKESEVPEKYTCSICLNPRRGRRSQRWVHDQDRVYEGCVAGARPSEPLRRSHELAGNLLRMQDALHALRVKYHVTTKKDHPKLYLWAKDWEATEISLTQEKVHSDYSDLNIMMSSIGKENLPVRDDSMHLRSPSSVDEDDRYLQRENQLPPSLLSGLLSSPGSLELPISTSELEKLAKSVQEQEIQQQSHRIVVPQPEAAIENSACRERLLRHIQRCQALVDARLDSIEAQVAELESQDPSFEDDETADYFPRTKQTIQMLMRDLDTMEALGVLT